MNRLPPKATSNSLIANSTNESWIAESPRELLRSGVTLGEARVLGPLSHLSHYETNETKGISMSPLSHLSHYETN